MNQQIDDFLETLARFYADDGRHDMLWRQAEPDESFEPYKILVSELMLQQTQVRRVTPKYAAFLETFPTVQRLASAALGDVLVLWSGLGYNRRAKFLWQAAQVVMQDFKGVFPRTVAELLRLPGVGPNSAGAILAYAYNQPVVYLETNIRTVLIHHFFQEQSGVSDSAIREVLTRIMAAAQHGPATDESSLPPREFYWAMMDYGAYLKQTVGNLNRASQSYTKQTTFHGSRRQLRGQIIRLLAERRYLLPELAQATGDDRTESVVNDLAHEAMIVRRGETLRLA